MAKVAAIGFSLEKPEENKIYFVFETNILLPLLQVSFTDCWQVGLAMKLLCFPMKAIRIKLLPPNL